MKNSKNARLPNSALNTECNAKSSIDGLKTREKSREISLLEEEKMKEIENLKKQTEVEDKLGKSKDTLLSM